MTPELQTLLNDIYSFGEHNDQSTTDRSQKMLNITPDTGELLTLLINSMNAKSILEIGTSNGYSTLWLAHAASKTNGLVKTIEVSAEKIDMARSNFIKSSLHQYIHQIYGNAGTSLKSAMNNEMDFIFLDSNRDDYLSWWVDIKRMLRTGGLLVVDNAISHATELKAFIEYVNADKDFITSLLPVGNGQFLASKIQ